MKYKNISKEKLELPGVGVVEPDGIVDVPEGFNNANFVKIEKVGEAPKKETKKEDKDVKRSL